MKIFQILDGFCHWDATEILVSAADAAERFAPDCIFADAPDYVFEGWGFDESREGDERFIQPEPPEGWLYDPLTGTFYEEGGYEPSELMRSTSDLAIENMNMKKKAAELEEMLTDTQLALCDIYENLILMTGGSDG